MELQRRLHLGISARPEYVKLRYFNKNTFIGNAGGQLLVTLADYLVKYKKQFDVPVLHLIYETDRVNPDGTFSGLSRHIVNSYIDIEFNTFYMNEINKTLVEFAYPFKLYYHTFVTSKPEYKPHVFGILQTLSLYVWIAILSSLIAMLLIHYVILKEKHSFSKTLLHVLAVLVRQSSTITPYSVVEKLLVYSWVVGAMFICLAYDSVFLSFLAFPPVVKIKDLSELVKAVEQGDYHVMCSYIDGCAEPFLESNKLKVIGKDIDQNVLSYGEVFENFLRENNKQNLAYIIEEGSIEKFAEKYFISEDRFLKAMSVLIARKGFCCLKSLETFVHKMMASGLFFKYQNHENFLISLPLFFKYPDEDRSRRKLTLTDVAPAFIVLVVGHCISFLCLFGEILLDRMKKSNCLSNCRRENNP